MRNTFFPPEFLAKYKTLLGDEWPRFFDTIKTKQPKGFWVNTNKATVEHVKESLTKKGIEFKQLPFHEQAFFIDAREPGKMEEYLKGWISIQEKGSMMPAVALAPEKKDFVFDTCASPGMKTIQLSNMSGTVFATDVHSKRFGALIKTKNNFALDNVVLKRIDFRNIKKTREFDKVLLDAPCSSEGLVRKDREALVGWSERLVREKAAIQKNLITKAFDYLKDGGEMVYSTCSFAPEEDEEVVQHLLKERKDAKVVSCAEQLRGVKIRKNELCPNCVRLYPQDNDTQQFFLAKIKKEPSKPSSV